MNNLGYSLARCRNFTEAEPMLKDTIERELRALDKGKDLPPQERTNLEMLLLQTRTNLGEMYQLQRNGKAAEDLLRKCVAEREKKEPKSFRLASTQSMLGRALAEEKKFAEAESLLLSGYKGLKDNANSTPVWGKYYLPDTLEWLAQLYEDWGKPDEAKKWRAEPANLLREQLADARKTLPKDSPELAQQLSPVGVAVEGHAHVLELVDHPGRFAAHVFDRVLVTEPVRALDGVVEVVVPVVLRHVAQAGTDAALRGHRVRTGRASRCSDHAGGWREGCPSPAPHPVPPRSTGR